MKTHLLLTIHADDQFDNEKCGKDFQANKVTVRQEMDDGDNSVIDRIHMKCKRQSWLRVVLFTVLFITTPLGYFIAEKSFIYTANYGMSLDSNFFFATLLDVK